MNLPTYFLLIAQQIATTQQNENYVRNLRHFMDNNISIEEMINVTPDQIFNTDMSKEQKGGADLASQAKDVENLQKLQNVQDFLQILIDNQTQDMNWAKTGDLDFFGVIDALKTTNPSPRPSPPHPNELIVLTQTVSVVLVLLSNIVGFRIGFGYWSLHPVFAGAQCGVGPVCVPYS